MTALVYGDFVISNTSWTGWKIITKEDLMMEKLTDRETCLEFDRVELVLWCGENSSQKRYMFYSNNQRKFGAFWTPGLEECLKHIGIIT